MVKTIQKSGVSRCSATKRVRGVKSRIKSNKSKKTKKFVTIKIQPEPLDINYYIQSKIDFLLGQEKDTISRLKDTENSEFDEFDLAKLERPPKYKQEHRALAIIGIKDILCQVLELNKDTLKISDNFIFSVISLYDCYIQNIEKDLSKNEMVKSIISCLIFIDKYQNVGVFLTSFFKSSNPNFYLDLNILNVVDLNLFPVKIFDYFDIFFLRISQINKDDKNYQRYVKLFKDVFIEFNFYFTFHENAKVKIFFLRISQIKKDDKNYQRYVKLFKDVFIEFNFYITFHENSKVKKPSINFISCLIMTYEFLKKNNLIKYEIVKTYIKYYKQVLNYDDQEYLYAREIIKESKQVYDGLVRNMEVNKKCKEGMINNINIHYI